MTRMMQVIWDAQHKHAIEGAVLAASALGVGYANAVEKGKMGSLSTVNALATLHTEYDRARRNVEITEARARLFDDLDAGTGEPSAHEDEAPSLEEREAGHPDWGGPGVQT